MVGTENIFIPPNVPVTRYAERQSDGSWQFIDYTSYPVERTVWGAKRVKIDRDFATLKETAASPYDHFQEGRSGDYLYIADDRTLTIIKQENKGEF